MFVIYVFLSKVLCFHVIDVSSLYLKTFLVFIFLFLFLKQKYSTTVRKVLIFFISPVFKILDQEHNEKGIYYLF